MYDVRYTPVHKSKASASRSMPYIVHRISYIIFIGALLFFAFSANNGCKIYKFNEAVVPDSIKTIKVNFIENKAPYVNPQLSPRLTDKLRQKIVGQTRLSQTNNDNADWVITGAVSSYSFSTSGISQGKEATNRLTIGVNITVNDQRANKSTDYNVSRNFEFAAKQTIQQAEATLGEEIIRSLTDDIFNKIFSNW
jgi:hypothetical protein